MEERFWTLMKLCEGRAGSRHEAIVTQNLPCPMCDLMRELKECKEDLLNWKKLFETTQKQYNGLFDKSRMSTKDLLEELKRKKLVGVGGDGI